MKFNRNILYCKYKEDVVNNINTAHLIETFCIVNYTEITEHLLKMSI